MGASNPFAVVAVDYAKAASVAGALELGVLVWGRMYTFHKSKGGKTGLWLHKRERELVALSDNSSLRQRAALVEAGLITMADKQRGKFPKIRPVAFDPDIRPALRLDYQYVALGHQCGWLHGLLCLLSEGAYGTGQACTSGLPAIEWGKSTRAMAGQVSRLVDSGLAERVGKGEVRLSIDQPDGLQLWTSLGRRQR